MIKKVSKRDSDRVKVTFVLPEDHPYGDTLSVVGDFNDWTPGEHTFVRRSNQTFSTNVMLEEGDRYAFRYYSDEHGWVNEEEADAVEPNEYGSTNCVVET
jgi:1,4-alpha-glucan branching enzyme